ncbi:unnamed protein product [Cuscuta europaea]|uniref:Uncharacterized protein n=1 Tax=Cuscuta europaea TaxID=41803 RepID=A0A9P0Z6Y0_CUSEU|nr:unnamed protein product [Cuscuta europaea]
MQHDRPPQRHRVQFMVGSPILSRMGTTILCSMIGPSAPSYPIHGRLVHSFQDGDHRLMQYDQPLSAIVSRSWSARPFLPGWGPPSYAVRSAPQRHRFQFMVGSSIPSRMVTTVLCSMIGPSAQSYPVHGQLVHSFQDGDHHLMQHDQPLNAIVSSSRSTPQFLPGWRPPSYAARSAHQCHRVQFTIGLTHSFQDGDHRLMKCDRPLNAIVSRSRSAHPYFLRWRPSSYAVRSAPQRHRTSIMVSSAHSLQDRDHHFMQHDRPLSSIVSCSCLG